MMKGMVSEFPEGHSVLFLKYFIKIAGTLKSAGITEWNYHIILSFVKKKGEGNEMTLFNASEEEKDAEVVLHLKKENRKIHFGKYELKMREI